MTKARGQVLLRPSLRPPRSDRCAPLAGPPGGEGAQIAVGPGDSWLSPLATTPLKVPEKMI